MKSNRAVITMSILSALAGGLVVALLVGVMNVGNTTTTVMQPAPFAGTGGTTSAVADGDTATLTAKDIYKRDAPGVVYVTANVVQKGTNPLGFGNPKSEKGVATGSGFVI